jgi:CDP-diacylglycerol--serine O-phosphatidyltransferase
MENHMISYLIYIIIPLILSNVLHMIVVKQNYFAHLATPIAESWFGKNKTWRGFIVLTLLNGLLSLLMSWIFINPENPFFATGCNITIMDMLNAFNMGCIFGFTYMIFELPNSCLKRKIGIPAGETASENGWIFSLLDKMDSTFGVSLMIYWLLKVPFLEAVIFFGIAVLTHIFFSWLLVLTKIKNRF